MQIKEFSTIIKCWQINVLVEKIYIIIIFIISSPWMNYSSILTNRSKLDTSVITISLEFIKFCIRVVKKWNAPGYVELINWLDFNICWIMKSLIHHSIIEPWKIYKCKKDSLLNKMFHICFILTTWQSKIKLLVIKCSRTGLCVDILGK